MEKCCQGKCGLKRKIDGALFSSLLTFYPHHVSSPSSFLAPGSVTTVTSVTQCPMSGSDLIKDLRYFTTHFQTNSQVVMVSES